jgi:conjugal transfer pilus assembly protein TraI
MDPRALSVGSLTATPPDALLEPQAALLGRIKLCFGADRAEFERQLMPLVRGYAGFVHLLPATADDHFSEAGGLLRLGLETAFFALQGTDAHLFCGSATITERVAMEPLWRQATFIAGLCAALHRSMDRIDVVAEDGRAWPACQGPLWGWLADHRLSRYQLRWRRQAREARGLALFALPHVVPGGVLQLLGQGNDQILPMLLGSIGGVPDVREHNILDGLVRRSLSLVIHRDLMAQADRTGVARRGEHLAQLLVHGLRRLVAGDPAWIPNRDKGRVWLGADGLFLAWPAAAQDLMGLLDHEELVGMPTTAQGVLDILIEAGAAVPQEAEQPLWPIRPRGGKILVPAVKLSSVGLLLAGLEPVPEPLEERLHDKAAPSASAPVSPSTTAGEDVASEPASRSASPASKPSRANATNGATQLPLLDDGQTGSSTPTVRTTPLPSVRLRPPARLMPSVREALGKAIHAAAQGDTPREVVRVPEGVFIALHAIQRHGVAPGVALRAMQAAAMLQHSQAQGLPTVTRTIGGTPTTGFVLGAKYIEGFDHYPEALSADAEPRSAPC